ncbi:hypothetical protein MMC13_000759 [Lambiella insularis]|nr:hypothetical protein [Lambiella insularis]
MSIRHLTTKSIPSLRSHALPPNPRLTFHPQKANLGTKADDKSHIVPPRKPGSTPLSGNPAHPRVSFKDLGATWTVKVVVIACLTVLGTLETIFYLRMGWAWLYPVAEGEEEEKES